MLTPRRRSARLASASSVKGKAAAPSLASVTEYAESPERRHRERYDAVPSSPMPAPSTPASSAVKPPHDEMHPSKAHQTMGQPSSALRLGFTDIKSATRDGSRIGIPSTPSKVGLPSSPFTFRIAREAAETELSSDAQRLMDELREQASKIKAELVAQREVEGAGTDAQDRKIAKPKGKSGRFSAVHMAEFKKMDSIEGHASAWRAQNGRFTPVVSSLKRSPSKANLETTPTPSIKSGLKRSPSKANLDATPTSQVKFGLHRSPSKPNLDPATPTTPRIKPSLKRKSSRANLQDYQQSPSPKKTAPPSLTRPQIFGNVEQRVERIEQRVTSKRFKQHLEDDASTARPVSRDGTSIPRPKSSGAGSAKVPPPPSGLARLMSPAKNSLSAHAAQGKPTISLVKSPSKTDLGRSLTKSASLQSLTSPAKPATPRARVISPGRFERVKSILRGHRTASGNVQTAIPHPSGSQTPAPAKIEKALPPVPLTTPRRKVTKHVAFTPEVSRIATEQVSPSPQKMMPKSQPLRTLEDQYPTLDGVLAKSQSGDVVYPDLSGFRPLPEPPAKQGGVKSPSVPGAFTFRSDHTIEFGDAPATGFGASPGQSSIRQVRQSIKPAAAMPGSFPGPSDTGSHPNKENKAPAAKVLFGAPHGMSNKKRHRASWDEEETEKEDADRAAKKRKNQHVPEGEALLAPRLVGSTPMSSAKKAQAGRGVSATPSSASPTKKRSIISMSRLNMLARPKKRVIGRSARLACSPCYAALLDLSICWVCGELIFRGDECVSFGWCFWHRACYGCLLCGGRSVCRGVSVQALFRDDEDEEATGGREVMEAPLCAACVVEMELDGVKEESVVVQRGLRRVDWVDGGLTRRRWEAKEGRGTHGHARRPPKSNARDSSLRGGDGADSEAVSVGDPSTDYLAPLESAIWVNIFDPINDAASLENVALRDF
ncbi:hypothetical protein G7Z17_g9871 [Cylindrodendrum hubeiense]|uniref:LIM zinc-binding domain-containing protein n=1 Tax=Cylindrodendrum hubeiense TaxID=595255 RepID=A0A9P5H453_9HYPO|nr:hypothetical protein G7Z17_g9871 [Cylindrodendrum hubeiense]